MNDSYYSHRYIVAVQKSEGFNVRFFDEKFMEIIFTSNNFDDAMNFVDQKFKLDSDQKWAIFSEKAVYEKWITNQK